MRALACVLLCCSLMAAAGQLQLSPALLPSIALPQARSDCSSGLVLLLPSVLPSVCCLQRARHDCSAVQCSALHNKSDSALA